MVFVKTLSIEMIHLIFVPVQVDSTENFVNSMRQNVKIIVHLHRSVNQIVVK